jgi:serine/threonine protein kinase
MNAAAKAVLTELPDIVIAYGISDEYRYIHFHCIIHHDYLIENILASSSINHAFCSSGVKGMTPYASYKIENADRRTASLLQRLYRLLRLTSFTCGVLTSLI